jgi:hypothetical protein
VLSLINQDDKLNEDQPLQSRQEELPTANKEKKPFIVPTLSEPFDVLEVTKFFFAASNPPISGGGSSSP